MRILRDTIMKSPFSIESIMCARSSHSCQIICCNADVGLWLDSTGCMSQDRELQHDCHTYTFSILPHLQGLQSGQRLYCYVVLPRIDMAYSTLLCRYQCASLLLSSHLLTFL